MALPPTPRYSVRDKVYFQSNGLVAVYPPPAHLRSATEHNSACLLLSTLPIELRLEIFTLVLGNKEFDITSYIYLHGHNSLGPYSPAESNLLLVCRQIYAEAVDLPFACNTFTFGCRFERDNWAAHQRPGQLAAIRQVRTVNPYIIDSINMTGFGTCASDEYYCGRACATSSALTVPFSTLFPNLGELGIHGSGNYGHDAVDCLEDMARRAGFEGWVEVVEVAPLY